LAAAEVGSGTAEVGTRAAKASGALLVDDRSAVLSSLGNTGTGSGLRRLGLVVALSVASLATGSTVESLVLDIIFGTAVSGRRAAAVEVFVGTDTGAAHAALSFTADIDLRNGGREGRSGLGRGKRGWGSSLAGGSSTGEGLEASFGVTVSGTNVTPSILGAAFACSTDLVAVLRATVLGESGGSQCNNGDNDRAHLD